MSRRAQGPGRALVALAGAARLRRVVSAVLALARRSLQASEHLRLLGLELLGRDDARVTELGELSKLRDHVLLGYRSHLWRWLWNGESSGPGHICLDRDRKCVLHPGTLVPTLGSNGALWSLSYEAIDYVVFPLLAVGVWTARGSRRYVAGLLAVLLFAGAGWQIDLNFFIWLLGAAIAWQRGRIGSSAGPPCAGCTRIVLPSVSRKHLTIPAVSTLRAIATALPARFEVVPMVAAGLGLRPGEVFGLEVADLDFQRRVVTVTRQLDGKRQVAPLMTAASYRTVLLPKVVGDALAAHLAAAGRREGLVFQEADGRPARLSDANRAWPAACAEAKAVGLRMHDCRHAYASALIAAGESVKTIQAHGSRFRDGHARRVPALVAGF
jgi:integrase